ncbi:hypothetical protein BC567DRAFT_42356 [Phyllosticta citribraziliensis]
MRPDSPLLHLLQVLDRQSQRLLPVTTAANLAIGLFLLSGRRGVASHCESRCSVACRPLQRALACGNAVPTEGKVVVASHPWFSPTVSCVPRDHVASLSARPPRLKRSGGEEDGLIARLKEPGSTLLHQLTLSGSLIIVRNAPACSQTRLRPLSTQPSP